MASGLTEGDLSGVFDLGTLTRGAELWHRKHVGRVEVSADGLRIAGSVLGSQRRPYTQTVSLVPKRGGHGVRIVGYCTCRMGRDCKHVAALLMEHLAALDETDAAPDAGRAPPPAASVPDRMALSEKVAGWLDRLTSAAVPAVAPGAEVFKPNQRQLRYILNHRDAPAGGGAAAALVRAVSVKFKKDGGFHDEKRYDPNNATRPELQLPQFLTADDIAILRDLDWVRQKARLANATDTPLGADAAGLRLLEAMLATGRLYHGTVDGPTLRSGPELAAEPRWVKSEHATQRLAFVPALAAPAGDGERARRRRRCPRPPRGASTPSCRSSRSTTWMAAAASSAGLSQRCRRPWRRRWRGRPRSPPPRRCWSKACCRSASGRPMPARPSRRQRRRRR